ncbi:calcium-binding protein [Rhizobium rhizogenes]|uniref:calcium-binding protein n=1 Tax=Rhizobium rhizogenes TaxID=359 RepID=UPI0022BE4EF9|nr:calcium-binding protein [Rhizobium rhizogenes]MCZ7488133.1 calcium-binding protein [Rhizobium rhizogenes]
MIVYSYTDLTIQNAILNYLYGTFSPSGDYAARIRENKSIGDTLAVGLEAFMLDGPGRYIKPSNFSIVSAFFDQSISLGDGSYNLPTLMGLNGFTDKSSFRSIQQYPIDVASSDYDVRAFVWGTTGYQIKNAIFAVKDGIRAIESIEIIAQSENFDFRGGRGTSFINSVLSELVDPMEIGLKFNISFVGQGSTFDSYTIQNFSEDSNAFSRLTYPEIVWKGYLALFESAAFKKNIQENPLTSFLEEGRNVLYGNREDDDLLDAESPTNNADHDKLPVVLVGGAGRDKLIGSEWSDLLFGGSGDDIIYTERPFADNSDRTEYFADTVFAGEGNDVVYGGDGYDLISLGDGNDTVNFKGDWNRSIVWGGAGVDRFLFDSKAHVLLLTMPDVTEELFGRLSPEMLFGIIDSREYPYTHILINVDNEDEIYFEGIKLGKVVIETEFKKEEKEGVIYADREGAFQKNIWYRYPISVYDEFFERYDRQFKLDDNKEIAVVTYNTSSAGYSLGFRPIDPETKFTSRDGLSVDGFVDGVAGVNVQGNAYEWNSYAKWGVYSYVPVDDEIKTIEEPPITRHVTTAIKWGKGEFLRGDEGYGSSDTMLKADGYEAAKRYFARASDYLIDDDEDHGGDKDYTGKPHAQRFKKSGVADGVDYSSSSGGIGVNMAQGRGERGDATGDLYQNIKRIIGSDFDDSFVGGAADNQFIGGSGDDFFGLREMGKDSIEGGDGQDSVAFQSNISQYHWSITADGSIHAVKNNGYSVTLRGVEHFSFLDGYLTRVDVEKLAIGDANETVTATSGNEFLSLGRGDDTYIFGRQVGYDVIVERVNEGANDKVKFVELAFSDVGLSRSGNDLLVIIPEFAPGVGNASSVLIKNTLLDDDAGVESLVFTDWTYSKVDIRSELLSKLVTSGNDVVEGFDNTADYLEGGAGNDAFIFKPNFGWDTIGDFAAGAGADDVIEFRGGIFADFEAVLAAASQVGNDTIINVDGTHGITIANISLSELHRDDVRLVA